MESGKIGIKVLENLLEQADAVMEDLEPLYIKKWIFAHNGLTKEAEEFAKEKGIFWSARKELDELLEHLNLRALYSFKQ